MSKRIKATLKETEIIQNIRRRANKIFASNRIVYELKIFGIKPLTSETVKSACYCIASELEGKKYTTPWYQHALEQCKLANMYQRLHILGDKGFLDLVDQDKRYPDGVRGPAFLKYKIGERFKKSIKKRKLTLEKLEK